MRYLDLADRASVAAFAERLGRAAAHARQQRRRDGLARGAHAARAGSCSSRPTTSATSRSRSACTRHSRPPATRASSSRQLERAPALAGRLRRHPLRAAPVRAVAGLRPVEDGQRAVRRRGDEALGRRRHHRQRAHARRDPHQPAAPRRDDAATSPAGPRPSATDLASGRAPSRAPRRRSCSPPRRCSRASAAATSRTATRPPWTTATRAVRGVRSYALDPEAATRLWDVSLEHARDAGRRARAERVAGRVLLARPH